jgi:hypothetical protein
MEIVLGHLCVCVCACVCVYVCVYNIYFIGRSSSVTCTYKYKYITNCAS